MDSSPILKFALATIAILTIGAAGGLIASTEIASRAYQYKFDQSGKHEQSMQVTGSARKRIRSDLTVWKIQISAQAKEISAAYGALKESGAKVQEFLEKHGFKPSEITSEAVQTETNYRIEWKGIDGHFKHETRDVDSYNLSKSFTVTTSRVDSVATPAAAITELLEKGVKVVSTAPAYYYSTIADLKVEMIGEATRDARARADQIVNNAGCKICEVRQARMGVLQITQPNSTDVTASGVYDTTTIEKDVTAVVSLTLGIR